PPPSCRSPPSRGSGTRWRLDRGGTDAAQAARSPRDEPRRAPGPARRAGRRALPSPAPPRHLAALQPDEGPGDPPRCRPGADGAPAADGRRGSGRMSTGRRKQRDGVVVSDKMDKTVVVVVARLVRHGKYRKYLTQRVRYKAHDEQNKCRVGDRVRIIESRPLSRDKRWAVLAILGRDEGAGEALVGTEVPV